MNEFVLVMTLVLTSAHPSVIEARFSSQSDCDTARIAVLKEAALVKAHLRIQEQDGHIAIDIPQIAAVCSFRSN